MSDFSHLPDTEDEGKAHFWSSWTASMMFVVLALALVVVGALALWMVTGFDR